MLTARELRTHFSVGRTPTYLEIAANAARQQAKRLTDETPGRVVAEHVLIAPDVMPHHYTARAVIHDLQPSQMVSALCAVEDTVKRTYPHAQRTGWRAASDGLIVFFHAF